MEKNLAEFSEEGLVPYQALVEQSLVGIYVIQDYVLRYANQAFVAITGHQLDEVLNKHIGEVLTPESYGQVVANIEQRIRDNSSIRYVTRSVHKDGRVVELEVHGTAVMFHGRPAVAGVAIDVTERMKFERDLQESREQLRLLAAHANRVREEQRRKIARDIHDVIGGLFTSLKMNVNRILRKSENPAVSEIAEEMIHLIQEGVEISREMSEQLHPAVLSYLGLGPTIERYLEKFSARNEIACSVSVVTTELKLDSAAELSVFRILQEALTNIVRHAHATRVGVSLASADEGVELIVDDNGLGLESTLPRIGAIGLLSMEERAREMGATFSLNNKPGGGTRLRLLLPRCVKNGQELAP